MPTNHHIAAALAFERQRDLLEVSHRAQHHAQPTEAATPVTVTPRPDAQPVSRVCEEESARDGRIGLRITRGRAQAAHAAASSRQRERAGSR
jgi:hypothetical protein